MGENRVSASDRLEVAVWCGDRRLEDVPSWRLFLQGAVQMALTLGTGVADPSVSVVVSEIETGDIVLTPFRGRNVEAALRVEASIRDALETQSVDEFLTSWGAEVD